MGPVLSLPEPAPRCPKLLLLGNIILSPFENFVLTVATSYWYSLQYSLGEPLLSLFTGEGISAVGVVISTALKSSYVGRTSHLTLIFGALVGSLVEQRLALGTFSSLLLLCYLSLLRIMLVPSTKLQTAAAVLAKQRGTVSCIYEGWDLLDTSSVIA